MIKENQQLFNRLHVLTDALILYLSLPIAFWVRFYAVKGGIISVPLSSYLVLGVFLTLAQLFAYAVAGLYKSFRRTHLRKELSSLWLSSALVMALLLSFLFVQHYIDYSRWTLAVYFFLSVGLLSGKRIALRKTLRLFRQKGYNQKHVLLLGSGQMARSYLEKVRGEKELGYHPIGYVAVQRSKELDLKYLGSFEALEALLDRHRPDEVVSAIAPEDYQRTPQIIAACEKTGTKLSIIPFYAPYMSSNPRFDDLDGIPMVNIRHIPLDNWANAFCKRAMDIIGSLLLILMTSPVMLACAIGVKLSSPGPVIFRQKRIGRNKKPFYMYKFRSMRVNTGQDTSWSSDRDVRKTKFGAFLRKCSLDELPQFFNVLKGEMSLVGPRPELPFFVEQFKEDVPLYMVKHQVRPGITGWAQINGLRGDTSIKARVEHDIYYIEHWSLMFDIEILLATVFKGKFMNSEVLN